jgi:hypothetical protein
MVHPQHHSTGVASGQPSGREDVPSHLEQDSVSSGSVRQIEIGVKSVKPEHVAMGAAWRAGASITEVLEIVGSLPSGLGVWADHDLGIRWDRGR